MRSKFLLNAAARRELTGEQAQEHAQSPEWGLQDAAWLAALGALGEQVANFLEQHFLTGRRGRGGR